MQNKYRSTASRSFNQFLCQNHACQEGWLWVNGRPFSAKLWRTMPADWMLWLAVKARVSRKAIIRACAIISWAQLPSIRSTISSRWCSSDAEEAVECLRKIGLGESVPESKLKRLIDALDADWVSDESVHVVSEALSCALPGKLGDAYAVGEVAHFAQRVKLGRYVRYAIGYPRISRALRKEGVVCLDT